MPRRFLARLLRILAFLSMLAATTWILAEPGFPAVVAFLSGIAVFAASVAPSDTRIAETLIRQDVREHNKRNRSKMLHKIRNFWIRGVLEKSLQANPFIALGIEFRPWMVPRSRGRISEEPAAGRRVTPGTTEIIDVFDQCGSQLLILGDPGSGKTTLMLQLAHGLLDRAENDEDQPIPVVLNLSSWPDRADPLAEWIVGELGSRYQVPSRVANAWIEDDQLLLLLDGLDEVREDRRSRCVEAVNSFLQEHGFTEIAVCSRVQAYEALPSRLSLHNAVFITPLNSQQIDTYLAKVGEDAPALRQTLESDPGLRELATSPLILTLMRQAHRSMSSVPDGTTRSATSLRNTILAGYLSHVLSQPRANDQVQPQQLAKWLSSLARIMDAHDEPMFLLERIQPSWLGSHKWKYSVSVRVLGACLFPLVSMSYLVLSGLVSELRHGRDIAIILKTYSTMGAFFGAMAAATFVLSSLHEWLPFFRRLQPLRRVLLLTIAAWALSAGIAVAIAVTYLEGTLEVAIAVFFFINTGSLPGWVAGGAAVWDRVHLGDALTWSWRRALSGATLPLTVVALPVAGRVASLLAGPHAAYFADEGLVVQNYQGVIYLFAAICVLFLGPSLAAFGLLRALRSTEVSDSAGPHQGIKKCARGALVGVLLFGVTFSLMYALLGESPRTYGTFMAAFALAGGLIYGGLALVQHFTLRVFLSLTHLLPWNCIRLLDVAADRMIVRKVGGGYVFTHRLLQEYLATLNTPPGRNNDDPSSSPFFVASP